MTTAVEMVREAWHRIETWCRKRHPALLDTLNPGATDEEIASLEATIERRLPEDVRESLKLHNGQPDFVEAGLLFGFGLLSCKRVRAEWRRWRGPGYEELNEQFGESANSFPEQAIQHDYANGGWIPLSEDLGGNFLGVDLAPGTNGMIGQVINFGRDEQNKGVLAQYWGEFLFSYATYLESDILGSVSPNLDEWAEQFYPLMGEGHIHDNLVRWTKVRRWPLPRRNIDIDPSWRTPTVVALAQSIAEEGDAERMPILGDALQDAGCDDAEIIDHCQICGPSVLGCWVISALLEAK